MKELELYKLLLTEDNTYETCLVDELGWISNDIFCVWVSYAWLNEFMEECKNIFGESIFDDGGFNVNFQHGGVCLELNKVLCNYGIDFETIFPKNKYQH